ncbi:MAG TPA: 2-oxoisovalerate dehydrogenase [Thermoflexia bacterium]|nr:2-oxoisovalerate dehydrogenase [Thermoflexia bacterium]
MPSCRKVSDLCCSILGYAIFTEADTWEELKEAVQDAVRCHFDEKERPAMVWLRLVQEEAVPV